MTSSQRSVGFGSLVEDIFGLNIRGLITIRDVIVRPRVVAEAARDEEWLRRYTPSIRLVFFLLTLTSVFRFLWAPKDSAITARLSEAFQGQVPDGMEAGLAADQYMAVYGALYPLLVVAFVVLAAVFVRVWGREASATLRIRLHLMVVIPSSACSALSIWTFALYDGSISTNFVIATLIGLTIGLLVDFVMAFRCVAATGQAVKIGKALLFSVVTQTAHFAAAGLSANVAVVVATNGI
ncbi:MAG: hypothetical protein AAFR65_06320 [Pseudomonadota bacterium]